MDRTGTTIRVQKISHNNDIQIFYFGLFVLATVPISFVYAFRYLQMRMTTIVFFQKNYKLYQNTNLITCCVKCM